MTVIIFKYPGTNIACKRYVCSPFLNATLCALKTVGLAALIAKILVLTTEFVIRVPSEQTYYMHAQCCVK